MFTGRNEVVAKVIFLHLSVILFTGGVCLSACWDTTPPEQTPPGSRHPPEQQPPPRSRHPPRSSSPPPGSRLQYTVYERPVRILLECILVWVFFFSFSSRPSVQLPVEYAHITFEILFSF